MENSSLHSNLPPINPIKQQQNPFDIFSNKKIVSSTSDLRNQGKEVSIMSDELISKLAAFEHQSANDVVYNALKQRSQF